MYKLNGIVLDDFINVVSVKIQDCYKNTYFNEVGVPERVSKFNGRITLTCSLPYTNSDELVSKLNSVDKAMKDGVLEIGPKSYNVQLLSGIDENTYLYNFKIAFGWNGTYLENGGLNDVSV